MVNINYRVIDQAALDILPPMFPRVPGKRLLSDNIPSQRLPVHIHEASTTDKFRSNCAWQRCGSTFDWSVEPSDTNELLHREMGQSDTAIVLNLAGCL